MITREVIDTLYKKYHNTPKTAEEIDMALLHDLTNSHHNLSLDERADRLTIGSVAHNSPFSSIAMHCINGIVPFDNWVAIVMHSSILFLSRRNSDVSVHIKPVKVSFLEKFCSVCAL